MIDGATVVTHPDLLRRRPGESQAFIADAGFDQVPATPGGTFGQQLVGQLRNSLLHQDLDAHSGESVQQFRRKPSTGSGGNRPPSPEHAVHYVGA